MKEHLIRQYWINSYGLLDTKDIVVPGPGYVVNNNFRVWPWDFGVLNEDPETPIYNELRRKYGIK